jgi:hypothetical protein
VSRRVDTGEAAAEDEDLLRVSAHKLPQGYWAAAAMESHRIRGVSTIHVQA